MTKNYTVKEYPSLTAIVHQMVKNAPSGLTAKSIWEVVGYTNYQTMMSEISRQPGHKLGADMLLAFMDACESDAPLTFLARERGCVVLKLPEATGCSGELVKNLSNSIKEFGEFASETAMSISDGNIPRDQLDRITKEGHEAIEAILAMVKLARVTHETQYGG